MAVDTASDERDQLVETREQQHAWQQANSWRYDRIREIDQVLDHHWADVALRAVRADDPLAFSVDCVRGARVLFETDLKTLERKLPPDRRSALERAEQSVRRRQAEVRQAERALTAAEGALEDAKQRRWGRRDRPAITAAERHLADVQRRVASAHSLVDDARSTVGTEREAVEHWAAVTKETAPERAALTSAVEDLHDALARTRVDRIRSPVHDPEHELWQVIGPPPRDAAAVAARDLARPSTAQRRAHRPIDGAANAPSPRPSSGRGS